MTLHMAIRCTSSAARSATQRAIVDAPLGRLPARDACERGALDAFGAELAAGGAAFEPPLDTLTTLKMRTRFQGQPEKTGELTVGHKDFVILPRPPPGESTGALEYQFKDVVLGGWAHKGDKGALKGDNGEHVKADSTNLALLQPSERWPGDHCAVFCYLDAAGNEIFSKRKIDALRGGRAREADAARRRRRNVIVYIKRDVSYLLNRTSGDANRPSLSETHSFATVMRRREPWYFDAADYVVDATGGAVESAVKKKREIKEEVLEYFYAETGEEAWNDES